MNGTGGGWGFRDKGGEICGLQQSGARGFRNGGGKNTELEDGPKERMAYGGSMDDLITQSTNKNQRSDALAPQIVGIPDDFGGGSRVRNLYERL